MFFGIVGLDPDAVIEKAKTDRHKKLLLKAEESRKELLRANPLLQARLHVLEQGATSRFGKKDKIMPSNRKLRQQMRFSFMLQYLRSQLNPTELAEVLADLNTSRPSKKTQAFLTDAAHIVDLITK